MSDLKWPDPEYYDRFDVENTIQFINESIVIDQWMINEVDPNWIYPYREGSQILHFECIYFNNNLTIIILNRPGWGHWDGLILGKIILRFGQSLLFQYQTSPLRFFSFWIFQPAIKKNFHVFKFYWSSRDLAADIWQAWVSCDMSHVIWRKQCSIRW